MLELSTSIALTGYGRARDLCSRLTARLDPREMLEVFVITRECGG